MNKLLLTSLFWLCASWTYATVYYVNDGNTTGDVFTSSVGNNANPGTSALPFATLDHAVNTIGLAANDTVFIDAGTYNDIFINLSVNDVSIIGAGEDLTIFDNNLVSSNTNWLLDISGDNIYVGDMSVTEYNANVINAISIYIHDATGVTLENVFTFNNASAGGNGAIVVGSNTDVTFLGGGADCNEPSGIGGGGVDVDGSNITVQMTKFSISGNSRSVVDGGGMTIEGDGTVTITMDSCIVADNECGSNGGGAIFINGGTLNINNTCFRDNVADRISSIEYGGAIYALDGTINIHNCSFTGNVASDGGAICSRATGGGSTVTFNIDSSSFENNNNEAILQNNSFSGTGVMNVDNCFFSGNTGTDVYINDGTATVSNCGTPSTFGVVASPTTAPAYNTPTCIQPSGGSCYAVACQNPAPTGDPTQTFCVEDSATIADLVVTGGTIIWYDTPGIGTGTPYTGTELLIDGASYYASDETAGCDPSPRLQVTVTLSDTLAPTIADTSVLFCVEDNANLTVADLSATGNNIQWYADLVSTTPLLGTDALVDGEDYYASQTNVDGCESSSRLAITVNISDTLAPTIADTAILFCVEDNPNPTVADLSATGNNIQWYADLVSTTPLLGTDALVDGEDYYATQTNVDGCESSSRLAVTVNISDTLEPTIADTTVLFCVEDNANPTVADLSATGNNIQWYADLVSTTPLLGTDALVDGEDYYATQTNVDGCESSSRLAITVNISDTLAPTIADTSVLFCVEDNANLTVADLSATGNNIQWYADLVSTTPLLGTDALVDGEDYYASQTNVDGCESSSRLAITVNISDTLAPTIADTAILFCVEDNPNPTVADLSATGNNIQWYADLVSTTPLLGTDALVDGEDYYATQTNVDGCESSSRLAITVNISDTLAPTIADTSVLFCVEDNANPTVADLSATGNNIQWYANLVSTTPLVGTDALVDGEDYYATQTNVDGCESSTRLAITVNISDTIAPTIADTVVLFCIEDNPNPTVSDLSATGNNIQWYADLVSTTPLLGTDALVDGEDYYATQTNVDGCESSSRLAITVNISDTLAPTGQNLQLFCTYDSATVSELSIVGNGITWYSDSTLSTPLTGTFTLEHDSTYFATQVNSLGCESSTFLAVTIGLSSPLLDSTNLVMTQSTCNVSNGSLTNITVSGGYSPYSWEWDNGTVVVSTQQDLTGMPAGVYNLQVTDSVGCLDTLSALIISDNGAPIIDVSSININHGICDTLSGSINNISISGGNLPFNFEWTDGSSVISTDSILINVGPGTYDLSITDNNGCLTNEGPFQILGYPSPTINSTGLTTVDATCSEANGSLSGLSIIGGNPPLNFSWSNGDTTYLNTLNISSLTPGQYTFIVSDSLGCTDSLITSIQSNPSITVEALDDFGSTTNPNPVDIDIYTNDIGNLLSITLDSGPYNGSASINNGIVTYTPNAAFGGQDSLEYTICDEFCTTICSTATVYIDVELITPLHIPNGFSPNQDGFNDVFFIEGLEQYPNNDIIIFNRWGDMVFEAAPYQNNWDGTTTNSALKIIGDQVTDGTYYFILNLGVTGEQPINGFVELRHE